MHLAIEKHCIILFFALFFAKKSNDILYLTIIRDAIFSFVFFFSYCLFSAQFKRRDELEVKDLSFNKSSRLNRKFNLHGAFNQNKYYA